MIEAHEDVVALSMPSRELASRITSHVSAADCLQAQEFFLRKGIQAINIYSLEDAVCFLDGCKQYDSVDEALNPKISIGYLDLVLLRDWVGETLGDRELATAIGKEIGEGLGNSRKLEERGRHFKLHAQAVKRLMECRLKQCEQIQG